ncbi:hypothetical protein [Streptomyces sp. NPDC046261]|uniref:RICIN domain-containing protein n=1 Tax=Streptomyces sp. NPDC046261 TaxID=3157200 RepID=UPI0033E0634A
MSSNSSMRPSREIVNRADGSRLSAWAENNTSPGSEVITTRASSFDSNQVTRWNLERQDGGTWLVRNAKDPAVCLQLASAAAVDVKVVLQKVTGDLDQRWEFVPEHTDLDAVVGDTGWWTLRPATNRNLAVTQVTLATGGWSHLALYRATDSADRLWHHQEPGADW